MITNSPDWLFALGRASVMLAISAIVMSGTLWLLRITSSRIHRLAWTVVLLQGVLFFRVTLSVPSEYLSSPASIPIVPTLNLSEQTFADPEVDESSDTPYSDLPQSDLPNKFVTDRSSLHSEPITRSWNWWQVSGSVWLLGSTVLIVGWLSSYLYFVWHLNPKPAVKAWQQEWRQMLADAEISKPIKLQMTQAVGPALCFLPTGYYVLIPERATRNLLPAERRAVLRHELAHYQRGDLWKSLAVRLLVCVHWFNLAAWWAARQFEICGEWLCDDRVAREFDAAVYARALLKIRESGLKPVSHGHGVHTGELFLRIRRILVSETDVALHRFSWVVVTACLFVCGLIRFETVAEGHSTPVPIADSNDDPSTAPKSTNGNLPAGALRQLGTNRLRHPSRTYRAVYSPDGNTLAVCGDGTYDAGSSVVLWNTRTGKLQIEIPQPVCSLAYSPSGRLLAGGDFQGRIHIWKATTGEIEKVLIGKFTGLGDLRNLHVHGLAFLDDKTIVSAHLRNSAAVIRRWDLMSGEELPRHQKYPDGTSAGLPVLVTSQQGKLLASAMGNKIQIWNLESDERPITIECEPFLDITTIEFAENAQILVACGRDKTSGFAPPRPKVQVWDLSTMRRRAFPSQSTATETAQDIALDHKHNRLIVATYKAIEVLDLATGKVLSQFDRPIRHSVSIVMHPGGKQLALYGNGSKIELLDIESGKSQFGDSAAHTNPTDFVAYLPDGQQVVTAARDESAFIWDSDSGTHVRALPGIAGERTQMNTVGISPDGQTAVVSGHRAQRREEWTMQEFPFNREDVAIPVIQLFDVTTGVMKKELRMVRFGSRVAFSSDSKLFAINANQHSGGSKGKFGVIKVFDVDSGKEVHALWGDQHVTMALAFSVDPPRLWSVSNDAKIRCWDLAAEKLEQETVLSSERVDSASISTSSWRVATVHGDHIVQLWDLKTGQLIRYVEVPGTAGVLAFSPDGARLAVGTQSRSLFVHNVVDGKVAFEATKLPSRPRSLAFSPDGSRLISGLEDGSAIIWNVAGGKRD